MFDLTKQERIVLISLVTILFFGTLLHYVYQRYPHLSRMMNILESDKIYHKMDINKATFEQLVNLPSIGPVTAKRIIDYRQEKGSFTSLEELKNIQGIGNVAFGKIVKFLKTLPEK